VLGSFSEAHHLSFIILAFPKILVVMKSVVRAEGHEIGRSAPVPSEKKRFWKWLALIIHFVVSIATALVVILALDGYKALDGNGISRNRNGKFKLRSSDIITLLSAIMTVLGVTASVWSGAVLWNCVSFIWYYPSVDHHGQTVDITERLHEMKYILNFMVQRWPLKKIQGKRLPRVLIAVALLPIIPQLFSAPLLEGSLNWQFSFEFGANQYVASRYPTSNFPQWRYYSTASTIPYTDVNIAAGLAGVAWDSSLAKGGTPINKRCRHVVNDNQFPNGSTLHMATIPCIVVHSITWPTSPMPSKVSAILNSNSLLSISGINLFSDTNNPGIAVLFDPTNETLPLPPVFSRQNSSVLIYFTEPVYPTPFIFSGKLTAIVQLIKRYPYEPTLIDPFGYTNPNNSVVGGYTTVDISDGYVGGDANYTYLEIEFTAGVATLETTTYINSGVIESGPLDPVTSDIHPGAWVREALYLMPDVMTAVAIMNTTSLNTWDNIANYTENLIRYSYLGAWDMLHNRFEPNNTNLTASIAEPRLQASVSKARVTGWVVIQCLFILTFLPIMFLKLSDGKELADEPLDLICLHNDDANGQSRDNTNPTYTSTTVGEMKKDDQ
jgi:hypothetical protein